ncbi:MAG: hypothetical protein JO095_03530 [Alphaproteobacteria bacterium]|nr:hypothetical protein [Alphaproteobacteria bacterium]
MIATDAVEAGQVLLLTEAMRVSLAAVPLRTNLSSTARPPRLARSATHRAVSPGAADGCIARMMRKPTGASLTSDAAALLSYGFGLLGRHERDRVAHRLRRSL